MKVAARYSHLNGYEWLLVHEKKTWLEIENAIKSINAAKYKTKVSDEKTMKGKLLYAPIELNKAFSDKVVKGRVEGQPHGLLGHRRSSTHPKDNGAAGSRAEEDDRGR